MVDVKLKLNGGPKFNLCLNGGLYEKLDLGNTIPIPVTDYNRLDNKPQINNVALVGNKFLQDLFPDGILINCGDSTGYPEPVIPPGVPNAEGVGF